MSTKPTPPNSQALLSDIRELIAQSRSQLNSIVNSALTFMYWHIGQRIHQHILKGERAEYGEQVIHHLAQHLQAEQGRGFSRKNLHHMLRFAEAFPEQDIVSTLSRQLSWSHFLELIYQKDTLKREFYAEMCRLEHWSVRTLRGRIQSQLFERSALSRQLATFICAF